MTQDHYSLESLEAMGMNKVPEPIRPQVSKLLEIQNAHNILQAEFNKKVLELEIEFEAKYAPLYSDRAAVVQGSGVETAIPNFWLTALKSNYLIGDMITEADEPALSSLRNIKCVRLPNKHSFTLEFEFEQNRFFTNPILKKTFHFVNIEDECIDDSCREDEASHKSCSDLYRFDHMEGTDIDWLPGANLTLKMVKKTQRHKTKNITRVIEREEKVDSFFNFFATPSSSSHPHDDDEGCEGDHEEADMNEELAIHLEIGDIIRTKIIPEAINWFLGIAEDDSAPFDDIEDGDFDGEEDEDSGSDDEAVTKKLESRQSRGTHHHSQNCKQQ